MLRLARATADRAHSRDDGALLLEFTDGSRLEVRASANYEAWQLVGPAGLMVVCMPGGELAVWTDDKESTSGDGPDHSP